MSTTQHANGTLLCTASGTFLSVAGNIQSADLVKTILLAAVGATVSFTMSVLLKWIAKRWKR